MLLQLALDARELLHLATEEIDVLSRGMDALEIRGEAGNTTQDKKRAPQTAGTTVRAKSNVSVGGASLASRARVAAFSQRIGVIFCAMYNVFVDADVLETVQTVAGRLAESAVSSTEWASTELGRFVHFSDTRSQDRVQKILALYADRRLQERLPAARVTKERSAVIAAYVDEGEKPNSRTMGLASFCRPECMGAYFNMSQQCERRSPTARRVGSMAVCRSRRYCVSYRIAYFSSFRLLCHNYNSVRISDWVPMQQNPRVDRSKVV